MESNNGPPTPRDDPSDDPAMFDSLVELSAEERSARLAEVARLDPALARRMESLLKFHDSDLLPEPASTTTADRFPGEPTDPLIGVKLGSFELIRVVGRGGMGVVYEAKQSAPERRVAVKILAALQSSRSTWRRFEREIETLGALRHPGIAQVFDSGIGHTPFGEVPWCAMEFVEGRSLTEHVAAAQLGPSERIDLLVRIADAVEHAHRRGIVHRDLKPANILVDASTSESLPKVLDFGIAKALGADSELQSLHTATGQIIGTLAYMSPEQAGGESDVDTRSDVYSLGVIAYELLADQPPYETHGLTLSAAIQVIREAEPRALGQWMPACRGDLEVVIAKAMEKDRERRYSSAGDLAADLRRVLRHEPVAARRASRSYRLARFARRNRILVGGVLATMLALIGGVIGTSLALVRATRARTEAQKTAADARFQEYVANIAAADAAMAIGNIRSAKRRLESAPSEYRHWEWHHLRSQLDVSVGRIGDSGAHEFDLSSDGRRIAALVDEEKIVVLDRTATGWTKSVIGEVAAPNAHEIVLSADGQTIVVAETYARGLSVWDVAARARRFLIETHQALVHTVALSPDGTRVAAGGEDGLVVFCDSVTGERLAEVASTPPVDVMHFDREGKELIVVGGREISRIDCRSFVETSRIPIGSSEICHCPALSPDLRFAACTIGSSIGVLDLTRTGSLRDITRDGTEPASLALSSDGRTLAVGERSGSISLWDPQTGARIAALRGHEGSVHELRFDPADDESLVSADGVSMLQWDTGFPVPDLSFPGHFADCEVACFSSDGRRFVTSHGRDFTVRVWDAESGECQAVLAPPWNTYATGLAMSPDGTLLAVASEHGTVAIWDVDAYREIAHLDGLGDRIAAMCFAVDGSALVVVARADGSVHHFETRDWAQTQITPGPGRLKVAALSTDARQMAFSRDQSDATVELRDVLIGSKICSFTLTRPLAWLARPFRSDGKLLLADDAGAASIRNVVDGSEVMAIAEGEIISRTLSADEQRLVVGYNDGRIGILDVARRQEVAVLVGPRYGVSCVAFSPDGKRMVATQASGNIRIFDADPLVDRIGKLRSERSVRQSADELLRTLRKPGDTFAALESRLAALPDLSAEVQIAVLRLARSLEGTAESLALRGWRIARDPASSAEALWVARGSIEAVMRMGQTDTRSLVVCAALDLRTGDDERGLNRLETVARASYADAAEWEPARLAYLAIALKRLGRSDEAAQAIADLTVLANRPKWAANPEAQELLQEARTAGG